MQSLLGLVLLVAVTYGAVLRPHPRSKRQTADLCALDGQIRTCSRQPEGDKFVQFLVGNEYGFDYTTEAKVEIPNIEGSKVEMRLTSTLLIEAIDECELTMKLIDVKIDGSSPAGAEQDDVKVALERNQMRFSFNLGKINAVCPASDEPEWVVNYKKGIISAMQNAMEGRHSRDNKQVFDTIETDVAGKCPTNYTLNNHDSDAIVVKEKNLGACLQGHQHSSSIKGVTYGFVESQVQNAPIVASHQKCTQRVRDLMLINIDCQETHLVRPFSNENDQGLKIVITQKFEQSHQRGKTLDELMAITSRQPLTIGNMDLDEEISRDLTVETKELINQICTATELEKEPSLFMKLVTNMRRLVRADLDEVKQHAAGQSSCKRSETIFRDALLMCGSEPTVEMMVENLRDTSVSEERRTVWLSMMGLIPKVTLKMIETIKQIIPEVPKKGLLGISSMIHRFCIREPDCAQQQPVIDAIESIIQIINSRAQMPEHETIVVLKALGNIGHSDRIASTVQSIMSSQQEPIQVRVAAIQALRRVPQHIVETTCKTELIRIFKNYKAKSLLRIEAFKVIMTKLVEADERDISSMLTEVVVDETDYQVGAFVSSFLSTIQNSESPNKYDLKKRLEHVLTGKWERFTRSHRHSSLEEFARFWQRKNFGVSFDVERVYESEILPQSTNLNMTVDLFGTSVNLFDLSVQTAGLDSLVQYVLTPHSQWPERQDKITRNQLIQDLSNQARQVDRVDKELALSARIFGDDIFVMGPMTEDTIDEMLEQVKTIRDQVENSGEVKFHKHLMLADSTIHIPTGLGQPLRATLSSAAVANIEVKGKLQTRNNIDVDLLMKPRFAAQMNAKLVLHLGKRSKVGIELVNQMSAQMAVRTIVKMENGELKTKLELPEGEKLMKTVLRTSLATIINEQEPNYLEGEQRGRTQVQKCTGDLTKRAIGLKLCAEIAYPNASMLPDHPSFPLTGPAALVFDVEKADALLKSYDLTVAFKRPTQENNGESLIKAEFDTPNTEISRKWLVLWHRQPFRRITAKLETPFSHPLAIDAEISPKETSNDYDVDAKAQARGHTYEITGSLNALRNEIKYDFNGNAAKDGESYPVKLQLMSQPQKHRVLLKLAENTIIDVEDVEETNEKRNSRIIVDVLGYGGQFSVDKQRSNYQTKLAVATGWKTPALGWQMYDSDVTLLSEYRYKGHMMYDVKLNMQSRQTSSRRLKIQYKLENDLTKSNVQFKYSHGPETDEEANTIALTADWLSRQHLTDIYSIHVQYPLRNWNHKLQARYTNNFPRTFESSIKVETSNREDPVPFDVGVKWSVFPELHAGIHAIYEGRNLNMLVESIRPTKHTVKSTLIIQPNVDWVLKMIDSREYVRSDDELVTKSHTKLVMPSTSRTYEVDMRLTARPEGECLGQFVVKVDSDVEAEITYHNQYNRDSFDSTMGIKYPRAQKEYGATLKLGQPAGHGLVRLVVTGDQQQKLGHLEIELPVYRDNDQSPTDFTYLLDGSWREKEVRTELVLKSDTEQASILNVKVKQTPAKYFDLKTDITGPWLRVGSENSNADVDNKITVSLATQNQGLGHHDYQGTMDIKRVIERGSIKDLIINFPVSCSVCNKRWNTKIEMSRQSKFVFLNEDQADVEGTQTKIELTMNRNNQHDYLVAIIKARGSKLLDTEMAILPAEKDKPVYHVNIMKLESYLMEASLTGTISINGLHTIMINLKDVNTEGRDWKLELQNLDFNGDVKINVGTPDQRLSNLNILLRVPSESNHNEPCFELGWNKEYSIEMKKTAQSMKLAYLTKSHGTYHIMYNLEGADNFDLSLKLASAEYKLNGEVEMHPSKQHYLWGYELQSIKRVHLTLTTPVATMSEVKLILDHTTDHRYLMEVKRNSQTVIHVDSIVKLQPEDYQLKFEAKISTVEDHVLLLETTCKPGFVYSATAAVSSDPVDRFRIEINNEMPEKVLHIQYPGRTMKVLHTFEYEPRTTHSVLPLKLKSVMKIMLDERENADSPKLSWVMAVEAEANQIKSKLILKKPLLIGFEQTLTYDFENQHRFGIESLERHHFTYQELDDSAECTKKFWVNIGDDKAKLEAELTGNHERSGTNYIVKATYELPRRCYTEDCVRNLILQTKYTKQNVVIGKFDLNADINSPSDMNAIVTYETEKNGAKSVNKWRIEPRDKNNLVIFLDDQEQPEYKLRFGANMEIFGIDITNLKTGVPLFIAKIEPENRNSIKFVLTHRDNTETINDVKLSLGMTDTDMLNIRFIISPYLLKQLKENKMEALSEFFNAATKESYKMILEPDMNLVTLLVSPMSLDDSYQNKMQLFNQDLNEAVQVLIRKVPVQKEEIIKFVNKLRQVQPEFMQQVDLVMENIEQNLPAMGAPFEEIKQVFIAISENVQNVIRPAVQYLKEILEIIVDNVKSLRTNIWQQWQSTKESVVRGKDYLIDNLRWIRTAINDAYQHMSMDKLSQVLSYTRDLTSQFWMDKYSKLMESLSSELSELGISGVTLTNSLREYLKEYPSVVNLLDTVQTLTDKLLWSIRTDNKLVDLAKLLASEFIPILEGNLDIYNYYTTLETVQYDVSRGLFEYNVRMPVNVQAVLNRPRHYINNSARSLLQPMSIFGLQVDMDKYSLPKSLLNLHDATAALVGNREVVTFDKQMIQLNSYCSYLMAQDFESHRFAIIANYVKEAGMIHRKSLEAHVGSSRIELNFDGSVTIDGVSKELPQPLEQTVDGGLVSGSVMRSRSGVELKFGPIEIKCETHYHTCVVKVDRMMHGDVFGMMGSNDGHKPDMHLPFTAEEKDMKQFSDHWRVSESCQVSEESDPIQLPADMERSINSKCEEIFDHSSPLAPCYQKVDRQSYLEMCKRDSRLGYQQNIPVAMLPCNVSYSFVTACKSHQIAVPMPPQCITCQSQHEASFRQTYSERSEIFDRADVVFVVEEKRCESAQDIENNINTLSQDISRKMTEHNIQDIKFGLIGFGGPNVHMKPHFHTVGGKIQFKTEEVRRATEELEFRSEIDDEGEPKHLALKALRFVSSKYPFRAGARKIVILVKCSACRSDSSIYRKTQHTLISQAINLHIVTHDNIQFRPEVEVEEEETIAGLSAKSVLRLSDLSENAPIRSELRSKVEHPRDACSVLAQETNGTVFTMEKVIKVDQARSLLVHRVVRESTAERRPDHCIVCTCNAMNNMPHTNCQPCDIPHPATLMRGNQPISRRHHRRH